jgi:homoserine dehydrogenase
MWLGQGAGGRPTATAVLGDVLDAARNRISGRHDVPFSVDNTLRSVNGGDLPSAFYISLDVLDEPGVLAAVAGIFGKNNVSIKSMEQSGFGNEARLSFLTHEALTRDVHNTIEDLSKLESVDSVGACIRVIEGGVQ